MTTTCGTLGSTEGYEFARKWRQLLRNVVEQCADDIQLFPFTMSRDQPRSGCARTSCDDDQPRSGCARTSHDVLDYLSSKQYANDATLDWFAHNIAQLTGTYLRVIPREIFVDVCATFRAQDTHARSARESYALVHFGLQRAIIDHFARETVDILRETIKCIDRSAYIKDYSIDAVLTLLERAHEFMSRFDNVDDFMEIIMDSTSLCGSISLDDYDTLINAYWIHTISTQSREMIRVLNNPIDLILSEDEVFRTCKIYSNRKWTTNDLIKLREEYPHIFRAFIISIAIGRANEEVYAQIIASQSQSQSSIERGTMSLRDYIMHHIGLIDECEVALGDHGETYVAKKRYDESCAQGARKRSHVLTGRILRTDLETVAIHGFPVHLVNHIARVFNLSRDDCAQSVIDEIIVKSHYQLASRVSVEHIANIDDINKWLRDATWQTTLLKSREGVVRQDAHPDYVLFLLFQMMKRVTTFIDRSIDLYDVARALIAWSDSIHARDVLRAEFNKFFALRDGEYDIFPRGVRDIICATE